ncbi:glycoside hydrolase family 47 protein [Podospora didyma]|uniref:alpha-1,2-Mannosidase n=1 Tax=Podospora didyma TaxID=330526 RepID=A0AAE0KIU2_9PEZI|nr:glycoside hydrolase family 47 protein [Podospora didyma]
MILSQFRPLRPYKNLLALLAFLLTVWYLLFWSGSSGSALESVQLEKYMQQSPSVPATLVKSSVEWSNITLRHPPKEPLIQLPVLDKRKRLRRVQHAFGPESIADRRVREERRRAVRGRTINDWNAYRKFAWKRDALMPISGGGRDQFSGWAATLVDSLDTLWIMGLKEEFDEAVAAVAEIDFGTSTTSTVNIFETTIRYLGGLLAAYDLSKREVLLQKAIELGDLIYSGFNTPNRMPVDNINVEGAKGGQGLNIEGRVVSASPGTLTLELTRLSQLTGDPKYYDAIANVVELFYLGQNETALPGLFPMWVSMSNADVTSGSTFTLGGSADSLYEYFPKMYALLGGSEPKFETLTTGFMETAKKYLFFRPMVPNNDDILISGTVNAWSSNETQLGPESEHLTCFIGGTFALAGRLFNREEDVEVGARLARGCAYAYRSFATGIMPERYNMVPCDPDKPCKWDEEKWDTEKAKWPEYLPHLPKGFTTARDPRYILRPEAIESVFYLWRITGEKEWQDFAWDMFQAVANGTATPLASASVRDVTIAKRELEQEDYMESFWIAETLKYFYLAFSPPDVIDLDKYVLNTEAHPFLRP